jgi:hypothetical protein
MLPYSRCQLAGWVGTRTAPESVSEFWLFAGVALIQLTRFLYIVFLAFDACFRLKRCLVSNELKDPSLGSGWAFLLQSAPYRKFLLTVTDQKEVRWFVIWVVLREYLSL